MRTNLACLQELPLSCCYRCPKLHVELARQFVPAITARPGAADGAVRVDVAREVALQEAERGTASVQFFFLELISLF